jgi:hypothetical protein
MEEKLFGHSQMCRRAHRLTFSVFSSLFCRPSICAQTEYKYCYDLVLHYVLHYLNKENEKKWEHEIRDQWWVEGWKGFLWLNFDGVEGCEVLFGFNLSTFRHENCSSCLMESWNATELKWNVRFSEEKVENLDQVWPSVRFWSRLIVLTNVEHKGEQGNLIWFHQSPSKLRRFPLAQKNRNFMALSCPSPQIIARLLLFMTQSLFWHAEKLNFVATFCFFSSPGMQATDRPKRIRANPRPMSMTKTQTPHRFVQLLRSSDTLLVSAMGTSRAEHLAKSFC